MSLLSSGTAQTILLLVAPFALPKVIALVRSVLSTSPKGTRTPLHPSYQPPYTPTDSPSLLHWRLLLISLSLSLTLLLLFLPPHNLFLSLSTPQSFLQSLLPALRTPLDLRLATETLARAWSIRLGAPLTDDQLALLNRLQTLDARAIYVAYGTTPMMNCTWCRPGAGTDYLLMIAPSLALEYLVVLAVVGLLLGGGRKHWRKWVVCALLVGGVVEAYLRATWIGPRGGGSVVMMHLLRHTLFALTLLTSYLLPPARVCHPTSTAALLSPPILSLINQSESLLNHLRATSIERMAILHHQPTRQKVVEFWTGAERESKVARADPNVVVALEREHEEQQGAVASFREWMEEAFVARAPGALEEEREAQMGRRGQQEGAPVPP